MNKFFERKGSLKSKGENWITINKIIYKYLNKELGKPIKILNFFGLNIRKKKQRI